jgi:predicted kinase
MLVVLSGLPGTGKSTIADAIARAWQMPVLAVDAIESAILRAGVARSFETGLAAYLIAETLADRYLSSGVDPVIDAVNSMDEGRDMWRGLARRHRTELRVIECLLADERIHQERLSRRDRELALGEPSWADVEARRTEWSSWPEPHLTLDATEPAETNIGRALAYLDPGSTTRRSFLAGQPPHR